MNSETLICDICSERVMLFGGERLMLVELSDFTLEKDAPDGTSANEIRQALIEALESQGSEEHMDFAQQIREKDEFTMHKECFDKMGLPTEDDFENI